MVKIRPVSLPGFDALTFFSKLTPEERSASYFTSGEWKIVAWNPSKTLSGEKMSSLRSLQSALEKRKRMTSSRFPFTGGMLGYIRYDAGVLLQGLVSQKPDPLRSPLFLFHIYDNAVLTNGEKTFVVGGDRFRSEVSAIHARPSRDIVPPLLDWSPGLTEREYRRAFERIHRGIRKGEYYQINFAYSFEAKQKVNPRELFVAFAHYHPSACASYTEFDDDAIVSLSPERFVTVRGRRITTCPIKGTRPRGKTAAEDRKLSAELLKSEKEAAELNMITDLLRNDIGKVSAAGSVKVIQNRALQKNPSVWHTYSVIEGTLQPKITPFDAFLSMFPGGSVTGCPKVAAIKEIARLEKTKRGPYCGSMIMASDNGFFDSTVLIRTIVAGKGRLSLGVGGGIVADSVMKDEWQETLQKAAPFLAGPRSVWINGKRAQSNDRRLAFLDPSNPHSFGAFETMQSRGTHIAYLPQHLKRLASSSALIGQERPPIGRIKRQLASVVRGDSSLRVKVLWTGKNILIETRPLIMDPAIPFGIGVLPVPVVRNIPEAKAVPSRKKWEAQQEALDLGYSEALLLGPEGQVPEAALSNLFWVKKGVLHSADTGILPGITRAVVLGIARRLKIPVHFQTATLRELLHADEVFLTRATVGVLPVVRIGKKRIAKGAVGPVTARLKRQWDRFSE